MKKVFLIALIAVLFAACEKEIAPKQELYLKSAKVNAKVTICHNGQAITVSENALKAHVAHGDAIDADGDGYFSKPNECNMPVDCDDNDPTVGECPPPLRGYDVVTSSALDFSDAGWGGWSAPVGKVVTSGGFQLNGGPAQVSTLGTPGSFWPHYTYGAEYGWVVRSAADGVSNPGSYVYAIYADMPAGYEIIKHTINGFNPTGWAGWSCPAGKVVLGGGFEADGPVKAFAPAGPNTVWPHYTYGSNEYGMVVQSAGATTVTITVICANEPAGYEIVKSSQMNYNSTGWAGWSVPGKVVLGGGFSGDSPVMASRPCQPGETTPFGYTYVANEWGWLVQSSGGGAGWIYVIYADI